MRRALQFLLRNWPLKLGAIVLATVLYSGLVLAQNVRVFNGNIPIEAIRQPPDVALLADLPPVTQVRYRAPLEAGFVSPDSFSATVNLADVEPAPGGAPVEVPVTLIAFDRRVQVIDYFPRTVQVRLDPVDTRTIGVTVDVRSVPEGVTIGPPQVDPQSVDVRGPSTRVAAIRAVVAPVSIDASGLNVDRQVDLEAVDEQGNVVTNVEIEPPRARVRIAVGRELASRTLPVVPEFTGNLPAGFHIQSVTVTPPAVTVTGESTVVTQMDGAHTALIDIAGRTRDFEMQVGLALPDQVTATGSPQDKCCRGHRRGQRHADVPGRHWPRRRALRSFVRAGHDVGRHHPGWRGVRAQRARCHGTGGDRRRRRPRRGRAHRAGRLCANRWPAGRHDLAFEYHGDGPGAVIDAERIAVSR